MGDRALYSYRRPAFPGAIGNAESKEEGYEEPVRLLRRATRLLDEADLCGANETLTEAAKALARRGGGRTGSPDFPKVRRARGGTDTGRSLLSTGAIQHHNAAE